MENGRDHSGQEGFRLRLRAARQADGDGGQAQPAALAGVGRGGGGGVLGGEGLYQGVDAVDVLLLRERLDELFYLERCLLAALVDLTGGQARGEPVRSLEPGMWTDALDEYSRTLSAILPEMLNGRSMALG